MDDETRAEIVIPSPCVVKAMSLFTIPRRYLTDIVPLLFVTVCGANILSMSVMNFLEMPTRHATWVYLLSSGIVALLFARSRISFQRLTRRQHLFCILIGVVLFLPRLGYVLEDSLGYSVNVVGDDAWHIQEMSAIIYSPTFPPRSTFDHSRYLSYYYAPWMLGAALYWTGFLTTVKQALALTVLIYSIFLVYFAVYASEALFSEGKHRKTFLLIFFLYGGFDFLYWLSGLTFVPSHSEWWAADFGFTLQYSNTITLALWVQPHLISALAILFSLYFAAQSHRASAHVICGLLLLSALFSSTFAALGAIPLMCWSFLRFKLLRAAPTIAIVIAIVSLPLWWIFLGRSETTGFRLFGELAPFWQTHKRAAFLVFLLIISLELMPLIAASLQSSLRRGRAEMTLFALCIVFLVSTFFIAFSGANNYVLRSSIVPIVTLTYLSVPAAHAWLFSNRHRWLPLALTVYALGGILEYASFSRASWLSLSRSQDAFHVDALNFNEGNDNIDALTLAARAEHAGILEWYLLERPVPAKSTLLTPDIEIMTSDTRYRITRSRLLETSARQDAD